MINGIAYTENDNNKKLSKEIWDGKKKIVYKDLPFNENIQEYGNYNGKEASDVTTLNSALLGNGKEKTAIAASVLAHEGSHAYGEKIEANAYKVSDATYTELTKLYGIEKDSDFANKIERGIKAPENQKANTGDVDHFVDVIRTQEGKYVISGGTANSDKNIYILDNNGKRSEILGKMLTENSFFDDGTLVRGSVIDCTDSSGKDFLDTFEKIYFHI